MNYFKLIGILLPLISACTSGYQSTSSGGSVNSDSNSSSGPSPQPVPSPVPLPSASCPRGAGLQDGCSSAPTPAGPAQYPHLLDQYGQNRPPWNVAGVDYYVGMPLGQSLTSWSTAFASCLQNPGSPCSVGGAVWEWNASALLLKCNSGNAVLNKYDFTTGTIPGFSFYVPSGGCTGLSVTNSQMGCFPAVKTGQNAPGFSGFNIQSNVNLVFKYNTVDYANCQGTGNGTLITIGGIGCTSNCSVDFEYNYIRDVFADILMVGGQPSFVIDKYNVIENPATSSPGDPAGVHENSLSWGSGTVTNADIEYNVTFSSQSYVGGEFIQMYFNGGGTFVNPIVSHNVFPFNASGTANNLIHGSACGYSGPATSIVGTAINSNNYFDGNVNAYYQCSNPNESSMTGWTSSANVNMSTGATIKP